jgi:hypothetical protein
METGNSLWQRCAMIEFRLLPDDHPNLAHSPMLRAALLTLQYAQEHGSIGLTKTKAFKRVFVHWAVEHFGWPGKSAEEMFRYNKVINEYEFPPLEVLHFLLISLRLGRHYKGEFRLTKRGAELADAPGRLFAELIPYFVLRIDHASYARFDERPFGKWDVWMNVINVEADHGTTEAALFQAFYGEPKDWHTEPPRLYRRVICSTTRRPYRVSSGLHRTPPLLLRAGCIRWGREGGDCYTSRPI